MPTFQPCLYQYLGKRKPDVVSIENFDDDRIYQVISRGVTYNILSATSVLSYFSNDEDVRKYYAQKLGGRSNLKDITEEDLQKADFMLRYSQLRGNMYDQSLVRSLKSGEFNHEILTHPSLSTATQFFTQQQVFLLDQNVGGTLDLLVRHEDQSWSLHDIKTHGRFYSDEEEISDEGVFFLDRSVQSTKLTKWRQQLIIYAMALRDLGIQVKRASVFLKNEHTNYLTEVAEMTEDQITSKWKNNVQPKVAKVTTDLFSIDTSELEF